MIRRQIKFYGRVQGVGFRYKAGYMAETLGLTGFVHNEYDGSVRMEIQGEEAMIDRLIQTLQLSFTYQSPYFRTISGLFPCFSFITDMHLPTRCLHNVYPVGKL